MSDPLHEQIKRWKMPEYRPTASPSYDYAKLLGPELTFTLEPPTEEDYAMFHTAMLCDAFENLVNAAHNNSKDKGFWGPPCTAPTGHDWLPSSNCKHCNLHIANRYTPNIGEKLMLMVSELSELFEAHRKGIADKPCDKPCTVIDPLGSMVVPCKACDAVGSAPDRLSRDIICIECKGLKQVTITGMRRLTNEEEELADVIIRVADYCGYKGIDLGRVILSKMAYNRSRPHMHGGKTC